MRYNFDHIIAAIDEKEPLISQVAQKIWDYAELSLQEVQSAALFCQVCREEGFSSVEEGICGIPTAFAASYGSGRPMIGILAEYDALDGLSQQAGCVTEQPVTPGGTGHGCGHNLLGAGALAAAIGIKRDLEASGLPGTVILFGCPGEEGGAAKAFMARDHYWERLDAALTWHPGDCNEVCTGSSTSCIQMQYKFSGIAAHAAGAPHLGRSALDAVELMNIGVQFLREHATDDARIHYAITDAGGRSPNVVQSHASVLYMVRANRVRDAIALQERVDKIADGAALMTETTVERQFIDGLSNQIPNRVLERVLYEAMSAVSLPGYTEEELDFADRLRATYPATGLLPGFGASEDPQLARQVRTMQEACPHAMNEFLLPMYSSETFRPGSTDVGDVSWECPTAQIYGAAWPDGCPGHSWQAVSCNGTSLGRKAALYAGKALAVAAGELLRSPDLLAQAKEEFALRTEGGFTSPIPADAVPVIPD